MKMSILKNYLSLTAACLALVACNPASETKPDNPNITKKITQTKNGPMSRIVRGDGGVSDFYDFKVTG